MSDQAATLSDQAATLRIVHLEKYFRRERGSQVAAIDDVSFELPRILEVVGIAHLRDEYSSHLSGGQQQRIALARCLVNDPNVILFDEPLSNVDAKVREELRVELLAMQRRLGFAGVYVTHDQEEAMSIADEVMVMQDGKAVQMGSPEQVYHTPNSRFVAGFVGIINEWTGTQCH